MTFETEQTFQYDYVFDLASFLSSDKRAIIRLFNRSVIDKSKLVNANERARVGTDEYGNPEWHYNSRVPTSHYSYDEDSKTETTTLLLDNEAFFRVEIQQNLQIRILSNVELSKASIISYIENDAM